MQTAYDSAPPAARKGMLADTGNHDIITALAGEDIVHGRFVTDQDGAAVLLPAAAAATDTILGVAVASHAIESGVADGSEPTILENKDLNVLRKGRIWVWCETAFTRASDTLYVRFTANGAGKYPGQVRNDADSAKADELGTGGYLVAHRVLNDLTAAGLLQIEINLP